MTDHVSDLAALLRIDRARLDSPVREEVVGDAVYPHIYGPLDVNAVTEVRRLR